MTGSSTSNIANLAILLKTIVHFLSTNVVFLFIVGLISYTPLLLVSYFLIFIKLRHNKINLLIAFLAITLGLVITSKWNTYIEQETKTTTQIDAGCTVVQNPIEREFSYSVVLKCSDSQLLFLSDIPMNYELGYRDKISLTAKVIPVDSYETFDPGYRSYLKNSKIHFLMRNTKVRDIQEPSIFWKSIREVKGLIYKNIDSNLLHENSQIIKGIVFGDKANFDPEFKDNLNVTGTSHIVSASGSNIMILFVMLSTLSGFININFIRITSLIITLPYVFIIGIDVLPAQRAFIMVLILTIASTLGIKIKTINAVLISSVLILIQYPLFINNISFQLSFLATLGIFYGSKNLANFKIFEKLPKIVSINLVTTLCAMVFTLPITLINFKTFSLISIVSNLVIIPVIPALTFITVFFLIQLLLKVSALTFTLSFILNILSSFIIGVIKLLSNFKFINRIEILYLILLLSAIVLFRYKFKMKKLAKIAIFTLFTLSIFTYREITLFKSIQGYLHITILDVGQGDSILIKTPNNYFALIDTGKDEKSLLQLQKQLSYFTKKIDLLILTHPDLDHIGGALSIIDYYNIELLFINKIEKDTQFYSNLLAEIQKREIKNVGVENQNDYVFDSVRFNIIWPIKDRAMYNLANINNLSIGIELSYNDFNFITMGDLEKEYERIALQDLEDKYIEAYKASHHGSKTSTSLKDLVQHQPIISFISAGLQNSYGHPHKDVLDIFNKLNTQVYRTDYNGSIELKTNGIETFSVKTSHSNEIKSYNIHQGEL